MTTQLEIPAVAYRIKTPHGHMRCSSLRPGDWLQTWDEHDPKSWAVLVTVNSKRLGIAVIRYGNSEIPHQHSFISQQGWSFVGRGKKRAWYWMLPAWLQKRINPYSKP